MFLNKQLFHLYMKLTNCQYHLFFITTESIQLQIFQTLKMFRHADKSKKFHYFLLTLITFVELTSVNTRYFLIEMAKEQVNSVLSYFIVCTHVQIIIFQLSDYVTSYVSLRRECTLSSQTKVALRVYQVEKKANAILNHQKSHLEIW